MARGQGSGLTCPRGEDAPPPTKFVPAKSYVFPRGKCNRSCQHAWFEKFPWLHYDAERDMVLCHASIRYLCRTGQALLGHTQQFGNLVDLLQERCEDVPALKTWLSRRDKWLSSDIQNEIIKIMAHALQREILEDIKVTPFFGIIADGTTDVAGDEQFTLCLRWVEDASLEVHEEFIGVYSPPDSKANTLFLAVKDMLVRLGLDLSRLRGHCFDGAANMSGRFSGVQKRIVDVQPKSIYVHCASHSLDLALREVDRSSVIVADALCAVKDVSNAILTSAKRKATYSGIVLPPCVDDARAIPAKASSLLPLCPTRALQSPKYSATGTKKAAKALCQTMANLRTEDGFDRVFEETQNAAMRLGLDQSETVVARRVKPPTRFEHSIKPAPPVVLDAKTKLRKEFFAAVDCVTSEIKNRFDQPGMDYLAKLECAIVNSTRGQRLTEEALKEALGVHSTDFDLDRLAAQLLLLPTVISGAGVNTVEDVAEQLRSESQTVRNLLDQVVKLVQLLLTVPASAASGERSFSALRRAKTYLRSRMTQARLTHLLLLHTHRERTGKLSLDKVMNEFITKTAERSATFGSC
ncbi:hypothetical protein HPB52_022553 [Rhipicephalus sanguineus]|uniref:Uncharacterized protein n=1 Tax=Rhipicephalus sanguineus TaxID=34632 RepID=A0A9D4PGZ0_RHISA|nr:hypothetical protein HPB52_022553 [Rhipicephalus sanguineus]